jgi:hypothetical protein
LAIVDESRACKRQSAVDDAGLSDLRDSLDWSEPSAGRQREALRRLGRPNHPEHRRRLLAREEDTHPLLEWPHLRLRFRKRAREDVGEVLDRLVDKRSLCRAQPGRRHEKRTKMVSPEHRPSLGRHMVHDHSAKRHWQRRQLGERARQLIGVMIDPRVDFVM